MRRKAQIERFLENCIYYNLKGVENMKEELYKIVIQGNELYVVKKKILFMKKREEKENENESGSRFPGFLLR